jgi:hypothetical protein
MCPLGVHPGDLIGRHGVPLLLAPAIRPVGRPALCADADAKP